ncbi:hypothetical protein UFOVP1492_79 [uncultured Caudovirales phage]|uniref:Uncharacterized protein n=1 Tax=uncultured Caudovirales phage TaxID=2100421 RepID=A0A6J5RHA3_9CAUD|nr:hypothetical protein UFOVP1127_55 [uncultured Caudovirales phage]CAB4193078.1 hypothetical protein UFOVP1242_19 [uncultured Caudovirales phage]CAB4217749.1 hypothetical protein UFOVP1492_79 [uncultured Caudovirales phage]CAB5231569.1 hypothetical protein UFOVP1580_108 [uncultured Caudovirales phage]
MLVTLKSNLDLNELAVSIFNANAAKGFWPENPTQRPIEQIVCLILTEVAEAVEAHRKKRFCIAPLIYVLNIQNDEEFKEAFSTLYKDTFQDEWADTFVRLFDLAGGYDVQVQSPQTNIHAYPSHSRAHFHKAVLAITKKLTTLADQRLNTVGLSTALNICISMCYDMARLWEFDLEAHVQAKLRYNSLRPAMHGGNTY